MNVLALAAASFAVGALGYSGVRDLRLVPVSMTVDRFWCTHQRLTSWPKMMGTFVRSPRAA